MASLLDGPMAIGGADVFRLSMGGAASGGGGVSAPLPGGWVGTSDKDDDETWDDAEIWND